MDVNKRRSKLLRDLSIRLLHKFYEIQPDIQIDRVNGNLANTIAGPRAAGILISCSNSGNIIDYLKRNNYIELYRLIPDSWQSIDRNDRQKDNIQASIYAHQKYVRIDVSWPYDLAENDITISQDYLGRNPYRGGKFLLGKSEGGTYITVSLQNTPNFGVFGQTNSGKTVTINTIVGQLSMSDDVQLVLIDGKHGGGIGYMNGMRNMVGPIAYQSEQIKNALAWAIEEMNNRYERIAPLFGRERKKALADLPRIVIVIDELKDITNDSNNADMIGQLASQCREAKMSLIVCTQHPTVKVLGDQTIKTNLPGRIALAVANESASHVALDLWQPKANYLLGQGDAYVKTVSAIERLQVMYIPDDALESLIVGAPPQMKEWPLADFSAMGDVGRPPRLFTLEELAISTKNASNGSGRDLLKQSLAARDISMGTDALRRLLQNGKDLNDMLNELEYCKQEECNEN